MTQRQRQFNKRKRNTKATHDADIIKAHEATKGVPQY